jgi:Ca2+-binding EF-hand superfamily protein
LAFDKTLDKFFKAFCEALVTEANSGPKPREIESYVDHYGKEASGFLSYAEFKEIHVTHVQALDRSVQPPEEAKLIALFNLFDVQSRGKVAKQDFVATINRLRPSIALIERLANKVRKGGERLIRALTEEF